MAERVAPDAVFAALAQRHGVESRAKGLQNAVTDYLLSLDMMGALKRHNFTPALAAPLLADSLVQELTGQRMAQLREVARLVTGPALRGMAILDPRKFYNLAAATGHEPPLSEIGELIESLVKPQEEANHEPEPATAGRTGPD